MGGHDTNGGGPATLGSNDLISQLQAASRSQTTTPVDRNNVHRHHQPPPEAPRFPAQPHGLPTVDPSRAMTTMRMCPICGQLFELSALRNHQAGCGFKLRCQRLNGCGREFGTVRQLSEHYCHNQPPLHSLVGILNFQNKANGQQQRPLYDAQQTPRMHSEIIKKVLPSSATAVSSSVTAVSTPATAVPTPAMAIPTPATASAPPAAKAREESTVKSQNVTPRPFGSKYTDEEDALLKRLRDVEGRDWSEICKHFPRRTPGSIKVRWCTKVKDKSVQETIGGAPASTAAASIAPTSTATDMAHATPTATDMAHATPTATDMAHVRGVVNHQLSSAVANAKTTSEKTPNKDKPKNPDASRMHGGRYTVEEQLLIKKWKEEDKLSWEAMHEHLPARAPMSIQVHYYTKLKNVTKEELQKRVENSANDEPPLKKQKRAEGEEERQRPRILNAMPELQAESTLASQSSDPSVAPSYAVQKLLVGVAQKRPEARPLPPRDIASLRNNLVKATEQGKLMPFGTDRCIRALDHLLGRKVEEQSAKSAARTPAANDPKLAVDSESATGSKLASDPKSLKSNGSPESKPDDRVHNGPANQRGDGPGIVVATIPEPAAQSAVDSAPSIELRHLPKPKTGPVVIELSDSSEDERSGKVLPQQQPPNRSSNREQRPVDGILGRQ